MAPAGLPNALTLFRTLAVIPIAGLLYIDGPMARWAALAIYVLACLTDFLDGWLARRFDATSEFGRMLDPIADKVLVGGLIVVLADTGDAPIIPSIVIIVREILIAGVREQLAQKTVALHVTWLAKWKTTVQMVAIAFLLPGTAGFVLWDGWTTLDLGHGLYWLAALLTAVTGYDYVRKAMAAMRTPAP